MKQEDKSSKIEELARRRGFFWIGSEIYNGLSGFYDYGHLGSSMKRKWENIREPYAFFVASPSIIK